MITTRHVLAILLLASCADKTADTAEPDAAPPPPPDAGTATLVVDVEWAGTGSITSSDGQLDCTDHCELTVPVGTSLELTATPTGAAAFRTWTGDCTGAEPCEIVLDQSRQVTAQFVGGGNWPLLLAGEFDEDVFDIAFDPTSGAALVLGRFVQSADLAGQPVQNGGDQGFLLKLSAEGTPEWVQTFPGIATVLLQSVAVGADGSAYITGRLSGPASFGGPTTLTPDADGDAFVAAFASDGAFRWAKRLGQGGGRGIDLAIGPEGDLFLAGSWDGPQNFESVTVDAVPGFDLLMIVKLATDGSVAQVFFPEAPAIQEKGLVRVEPTADGGAWLFADTFIRVTCQQGEICGPDNKRNEDRDRVALFASTGEETYYEQTESDFYDIAEMPDGTLTVIGRFSGEAELGGMTTNTGGASGWFIANLDSTGFASRLDHMAYLSSSWEAQLAPLADGGLALAGEFNGTIPTDPPLTSDSTDVFVARIETTGALTWIEHYTEPGADSLGGFAVDRLGNALVAGSLTQQLVVGGQTLDVTQTGSQWDMYLHRFAMPQQ